MFKKNQTIALGYKIAFGLIIALVLMIILTPLAMAFLGNFIGAIVSAVIGTVVGVAVGVLTVNPGAGIGMFTVTTVTMCSLLCHSNDNSSNNTPLPIPSPSAPLCTAFTATPTNLIDPGGDVTFTWQTANASNVSINNNIGDVANSGSKVIRVGSTKTYTLTAQNLYGTCTASVNVTVAPKPGPTATIEARSESAGVDWTSSDFTIVTGNVVEVRWNSTATSCSSTGFPTNGNLSSTGIIPQNQPGGANPEMTYRLVCASTQPTAITVTANDVSPTLSTSKTTVRSGDPFELQWDLNGNNPAECIITGVGSKVSTKGSITSESGNSIVDAAASGAVTYTLTCPGGTDTATVQIVPQVFES